ncbi:S41 family peptidase [Peristeroidobacter soli]|uniref:S41 family peptidase n=1 Tax=Peristeroidobacter soli TaxID=2497877 RepID=UPI00130021AB|nr:S41 family peptidase [Peristeroidobacter soli]
MQNRFIRIAAAVSLAGMHGAAFGATPDCADGLLSKAEAHEAIAFVGDRVSSAHAGSLDGMRASVRDGLKQLKGSVSKSIPASELGLAINRVLAGAEDAHLRLKLSPTVEVKCAQLPLPLTWSENGLLVRGGSKIPAGSRVLAIGKHSLEELDDLAAAVIPHENRYWARSEFVRLLPRADTLRALHLLDGNDSLEITYQPPGGAPARQRLQLNPATAAPRPWIGYETWPQQSTGLLWLDRCEVNEEFNRTLERFVAEVRQLKLRKVAIDLRGNPGGDSSVALAILRAFGHPPSSAFSVDIRVSPELSQAQPAFDPANMSPVFEKLGLQPLAPDTRHYTLAGNLVLAQLAQRLPPEPAGLVKPDVDLYLLVDGGTFSSAALFAGLVRDNNLGLLVGEPIGNSASFNASEIHLDVPHLPYFLNLSTARLLRADVNAGPAQTLLPDVLAPATPASLAAQKDVALEFVRARQ